MTYSDDFGAFRDLGSLVVPAAGALVETGDLWEPYWLIDRDGVRGGPASQPTPLLRRGTPHPPALSQPRRRHPRRPTRRYHRTRQRQRRPAGHRDLARNRTPSVNSGCRRSHSAQQSQSTREIIRDHPPIRVLLILGTFCKQVNKCAPVIFCHALKKSRNRLQKARGHIRVDIIIVSQIDRYDYTHECFRQKTLKIRHGCTILAVMFVIPRS
jgi:hypothetical protein